MRPAWRSPSTPRPATSPAPDAVTLVDAGEWQAAVAAASLAADPVGAPLLVTEDGELPELTESALRALGPEGSSATAGRQVFVVGSAAEPDDYESLSVEGGDPAALAAEIARLRERLADDPDAHRRRQRRRARLRDARRRRGRRARATRCCSSTSDGVPEATAEALRRNDGVPVYVLGPESAIDERTMKELERIAPSAKRVGAEGPVENAIAFARYADGDFGWNINDPGHGFVIANTERPIDAGIAAPLSASGTWGPLLLTDDARRPSGLAARLPARPQARLRDRPDPSPLQPRVADRRHRRALGRPAGRGGRARRGRPDNVRFRRRRCRRPGARVTARRPSRAEADQ